MKSIFNKLLLIGALSFASVGLFFYQVEAKAAGTTISGARITTVLVKGPCENDGFKTSCSQAICPEDGSACPITFDFSPMMTGIKPVFIAQVNSESRGKLRAEIAPEFSDYVMTRIPGDNFVFDSGHGSVITLDGTGSEGTSKNNKGIDHVNSVCFYEVAGFNPDGTPSSPPLDYVQSIYTFTDNVFTDNQ